MGGFGDGLGRFLEGFGQVLGALHHLLCFMLRWQRFCVFLFVFRMFLAILLLFSDLGCFLLTWAVC